MSKTFHSINEPAKQQVSKARLNQQLHSTGELSDAEKTHLPPKLLSFTQQPLWDLAFRPWFLAGTISSVLSVGIWLLFLHGYLPALASSGLTPVAWHIHEMLFGFGATIAVAFLLTAAQTWTNKRSINGGSLLTLTLIWLMIRALLWSDDTKIQVLALVLQAGWWLACIGFLASMVIRAKSKRNYQFIPLLSVMMLLNLSFLIADFSGHTELALHLARTAILTFGLLVGIVGGRVIPFFTGRGADNAQVKATPILDKLLPVVTIIGIGIFFTGHFIALPFTPAFALTSAGIIHLLRLWHWDPLSTRKVPLLWSLQSAYLALGLGLVALGVSYHTDLIRFADALHLITVGTIGGMILAMIARVSLGHTGRPLKPHPSLNIAFALMFIGTLVRFILPLLQMPIMAWDISAICWITAFSIFIWHYARILMSARAS
ncbi:NnrS family protein [Shewanella nanhaiensis]|uniref:NnrS family protein n=1 Tax=Shewanella nanhaiensis TaxID=2864872 RepID=A0ABS7E0Q5_9GAMM|nr:NnrS family protein [Shewanella nanhaiensis]MBW8183197.1 NnrS family protein [Shewanella nanhaiensis]